LQNEVNQVKDVMTNNIEKILQRGDKLDDLQDRTSKLENTVSNFFTFKFFLNEITSSPIWSSG
jgi:hypothetical protein